MEKVSTYFAGLNRILALAALVLWLVGWVTGQVQTNLPDIILLLVILALLV